MKVDDMQMPLAIRHGAANGIRLLNKYYSRSDDSEIYQIAMVLHPRYKLEYFRTKKWPQEWINMAVDLVRSVWEERYKYICVNEKERISAVIEKSLDEELEFFDIEPSDIGSDALDAWLTLLLDCTKISPLTYWHNQGINKAAAWGLARMAKDFLSIPATSIDVEQLFSHSGKTVNPLRTALSDQSIRATVVLNSWIQVPAFSVGGEFQDKLLKGWKRGQNDEINKKTDVITLDE